MAAVTKMKSSGNKKPGKSKAAAAPSPPSAKPSKAIKRGKSAPPGKPGPAEKGGRPAPATKQAKGGKPAQAAPPRVGRGAKSASSNAADGARLMKDSFRMTRAEFDRLRALKLRARALGRPAKKSELLRAGLQLLAAADDAALLAALGTNARR